MNPPDTQEPADNSEKVLAQLAGAQQALRARDKTIAALVNRVRDRQSNNHSAFALLGENAMLQQVVANKTLELEEQNRKLEEAHNALKKTQSQLLHAQKMESIGQLAAGVAHEINTPIQYIGDNTRFLRDNFQEIARALKSSVELVATAKRNALTPELINQTEQAIAATDIGYLIEQIPAAITETLEGVDRVAKIVRAMKEFSHPGTKEKTAVDINHAIETTALVARNEWARIANLTTDLDTTLPQVPCLAGEVNQVILNIIVNAAHAIAETPTVKQGGKGAITIRTRRVGDWAEIYVSDTGSGIPESARDKIFDPFFTTKDVGKGTGQGLFIAHDVVVKKHRGTIAFETELGQGTTFIIRLPLGTSVPT